MKYLLSKFLTLVLCLGTFGIVMIINTLEAKADVAIQRSGNVSVRSAVIESNRIIKVPKSQIEREKLSRGSSSASTSIIEYAYKFLGKPYIWAASGPNSFDCSGFTLYVYRKYGYSLPHYTGAQVQMGKAVDRKDLRAGDLVFFNTTGRNGHVGIYIGNNRFIHASSGQKKVMISNLSESYYNNRYSTARRIIN